MKKRFTQGPKINTGIKKVKPLHSFFESKILSILKKEMERDFASRELMKKAGIKTKAEFYAALKNLSANGYVQVDAKHRVSIKLEQGEKKATLVSLSKGFGFAKPEDGSEDVFVHGSGLNGAFVGDTVLLGGVKKEEKGCSGRVLRVLESAKTTTTGTVAITQWGPELIPDNNIRFRPQITELLGAKEGDKVHAKLVQDNRGDWTQAQVIKVFGSGSSARICSDAIIEQYGIPTVFPPDVLQEAQVAGMREITQEERATRLDLRDENIFTIDGADAKDLDDAIGIRKTENGYVLGVHIADVAHYVKGKSRIDQEALLRGTSVYFADRVVPMLPVELSNGACSLTAGKEKLCFSAIIDLNLQGKIVKYQFVKTIISSKVRGVYSEVNKLFKGSKDKRLNKKYEPVIKELLLAKELAEILEKRSKGRGTMEIISSESKFTLDENGVCVDIEPRESGQAQELIEQLMICANMAAAKMSMDAKIPFLYRIHENPDPARIKSLCELLKLLGISCKELMNEKPSTADFQAILARVKGTASETLVSERLLRTMEKAKYSVSPAGHFGLALKDYSHFTSPIRRYPDTSIHRILTALVEGESTENIQKRYKAFAELSATESSANEVRATRAERDAEDCYMAEFMGQHIGEAFTGTVSGLIKNGIFVRLANSVEGFVPADSFTKNQFVFDGMITYECKNTGRKLTIGSPVDIIVASSHVATGKVDFAPNE